MVYRLSSRILFIFFLVQVQVLLFIFFQQPPQKMCSLNACVCVVMIFCMLGCSSGSENKLSVFLFLLENGIMVQCTEANLYLLNVFKSDLHNCLTINCLYAHLHVWFAWNNIWFYFLYAYFVFLWVFDMLTFILLKSLRIISPLLPKIINKHDCTLHF